MNPAYRHARFRAELPHDGLPESFAVITACNPEGKSISVRENSERTEGFRQQLIRLGYDHFPVTGHDAASLHEETGFGVVCDEATAYSMGNAFLQEAIFQVRRGQVTLVPCLQESVMSPPPPPEPLRPWNEMADAASHPRFHFRGPFSLLEKPATAFLCSTQCPGDKVLEAYGWARLQCDTGGTVISGFHTPVEKDVLAILLRRGANILWVAARDLPKTLPKEMKPAFEEKRLMILSPFGYGNVIRPSREYCALRNCFVLSHSSARHIPHVAPGSSLQSLLLDPLPGSEL